MAVELEGACSLCVKHNAQHSLINKYRYILKKNEKGRPSYEPEK